MRRVGCLELQVHEKPLVIVVNGYGTILDSPLGKIYLPRVKRVIEEQRPEMVIFCGGKTFLKTMPNDSEASIMQGWIEQNLDPMACPCLGYQIEDTSYTTFENSQGAAYIMKKQAWRFWAEGRRGYFRIIHCCEATRAANVIVLDRYFMIERDCLVKDIDDITVETASWERADPFKQVGNLIHNKLAITSPWLGLAEREHKRRVEASKNRK